MASYRAELREAFARGVRAALPELAGTEVATLADACTGLVVSAFALVRVAPDAAASAIDAALALLADRRRRA